MPGEELIVAGVMAALIQGIQAWITMARMSGMTEEQLNALFDSELAKFNINTPDKLPDA